MNTRLPTMVTLAMLAVWGGCSQMDEKPVSDTGTAVRDPAARERLFIGMTYWDLDGDNDLDRPSADLWWRHLNDRERYLTPRNGAAIAVVRGRSFDQLTEQDLRQLKYDTGGLSVSDTGAVIGVGSVIAVRTNEGRYAKLQIVGFQPHPISKAGKYDMSLRYVIYGNG